jgi:hypothetical protein
VSARRAAAAVAAAALAAGALASCGSSSSSRPRARFDARAARATLRAAEPLMSVGAGALGYRVALAPSRPGVEADIDREQRRITLFLSAHEVPHLVAHDLAHEIGHAVDLARLTEADRRAYLVRRGRPGGPWWPRGASDYAVGAGDFAEVYALCHAASPTFRSTLAPRPADPCAVLPAVAREKMRATQGFR